MLLFKWIYTSLIGKYCETSIISQRQVQTTSWKWGLTSLAIDEIQIKPILRFIIYQSKWPRLKKNTKQKNIQTSNTTSKKTIDADENRAKCRHIRIADRSSNWSECNALVWSFLIKLGLYLPHNSVVPPIGIHPQV